VIAITCVILSGVDNLADSVYEELQNNEHETSTLTKDYRTAHSAADSVMAISSATVNDMAHNSATGSDIALELNDAASDVSLTEVLRDFDEELACYLYPGYGKNAHLDPGIEVLYNRDRLYYCIST